ncbi:MAG: hypothetical protein AB2A00_31215 [Myxococcota bacterium]
MSEPTNNPAASQPLGPEGAGAPADNASLTNEDASAIAAAKDRKKRRARKRGGAHEELNIYAMLDLMTIILVFLIKQWQSDSITISPSVQPPLSTITDKPSEAVRVFITEDRILLDDKEVARIQNGDVAAADLDSTNGFFITNLSQAMKDKGDQFLKIEAAGGVKFEGRYAIVADRRVPWSLLKKIIFTAGQTTVVDQDGLERSFGDLRLVTKKSGE